MVMGNTQISRNPLQLRGPFNYLIKESHNLYLEGNIHLPTTQAQISGQSQEKINIPFGSLWAILA